MGEEDYLGPIKKLEKALKELNDTKSYSIGDIAEKSGLSIPTTKTLLAIIDFSQKYVPKIEIDTENSKKTVTVKGMPPYFSKK